MYRSGLVDIPVEQFRTHRERIVLHAVLPMQRQIDVAPFIRTRHIVGRGLIAFVFALQPTPSVIDTCRKYELSEIGIEPQDSTETCVMVLVIVAVV